MSQAGGDGEIGGSGLTFKEGWAVPLSQGHGERRSIPNGMFGEGERGVILVHVANSRIFRDFKEVVHPKVKIR